MFDDGSVNVSKNTLLAEEFSYSIKTCINEILPIIGTENRLENITKNNNDFTYCQ